MSMRLSGIWLIFLILISTAKAHPNEMAPIPGGPFLMGSVNGMRDEQPAHRVHVDAFWIDRFPVTNADYARFLNVFGNRVEGGDKWLDNEGPLSSWLCKIKKVGDRFVPKAGYENHPVIKVSWYGARAYARSLGKRLPTEAEWEKAARGGLEGKKYVYGDTLSPSQANVGGFHSTTRVGLYPPNEFGLHDLAAGVWQWCNDWYDPDYYARSPLKNPQGPESGSQKVLRGGSWAHRESWPVAVRCADDPISRNFCFVTGFRCARDGDK